MQPPKKSFCFAPMFNSPVHVHAQRHQVHHDTAPEVQPVQMSHDSTGAFQPGMNKFKKLYTKLGGTVETMLFDNHASAGQVFDRIVNGIWLGPNGLDAVAYFGHGMPYGMVSAHIGQKGLKPFAAAIRGNCNPGVKIILYACSCARQNYPGGNFASKLADELVDVQAEVFGHDIAGHAYHNPTLYRYPGGTKVCPEGMAKKFSKVMHDEHSDFWARFPFMTEGEIAAEIGG